MIGEIRRGSWERELGGELGEAEGNSRWEQG
jgi:hypothetical protein